jgi:hypothetical protein
MVRIVNGITVSFELFQMFREMLFGLGELGLALQDRCVEFVRILPALDRYSSLAGYMV